MITKKGTETMMDRYEFKGIKVKKTNDIIIHSVFEDGISSETIVLTKEQHDKIKTFEKLVIDGLA